MKAGIARALNPDSANKPFNDVKDCCLCTGPHGACMALPVESPPGRQRLFSIEGRGDGDLT
jgi:hypothetical protein